MIVVQSPKKKAYFHYSLLLCFIFYFKIVTIRRQLNHAGQQSTSYSRDKTYSTYRKTR